MSRVNPAAARFSVTFATWMTVVTLTQICNAQAEKNVGKIVSKEDVVYGRVHGAGLLADIAYPESKEPLPAIVSVHGGRWVGGHKKDTSTIRVDQWAGFGFFAM